MQNKNLDEIKHILSRTGISATTAHNFKGNEDAVLHSWRCDTDENEKLLIEVVNTKLQGAITNTLSHLGYTVSRESSNTESVYLRVRKK